MTQTELENLKREMEDFPNADQEMLFRALSLLEFRKLNNHLADLKKILTEAEK